MWQEFKEFAFKGNAFDLAVGVIIGPAFGKIVDSIVNHLIMPIVGAVFGGLNFDNYFIRLSSAVTATNLADAQKEGAVFAYGAFLTVLINFSDHRLDCVHVVASGRSGCRVGLAPTGERRLVTAHTPADIR